MSVAEFEALRVLTSEYLQFPPFVAAFNEIERLVQLYRQTGIAQHLLVTGESGCGKTTLCKAMVERYPHASLPERDVIPVLFVPMPPTATIASVAEAMLRHLGDPAPTTGTTSAKTARVARLARACAVELILFDEANHIQDRGQLPTQYMVGDWLKSLMDDVQVPTVLVGLPRVENLLRVNEQLRRRFMRRVHLEFGKDPYNTIETQCLQLFTSLTPSLPVPFNKGSMTWSELAHRLHAATDGRVSYVKSLLIGVIRRVFEQNVQEITLAVLETAFTSAIWPQGVGALNPFCTNFDFRRLDRAGEPFHPRDEVGRPSSRRRAHAA
ncbi:MAG TPA: TniB family NTP-binding protein [Zoogloea sp.]|nr:TniB family NTP-binding protein [Zoogloea sp.]HRH71475.1 TniB family NTP-binding protein [Zoogloea sp.]